MNQRLALVTGGGSGIGREICLGLARDGRNIAVADINLVGAQETTAMVVQSGGTAIAVHMDVSETDAVHDSVIEVIDELGAIEVLVNCAGWDELMPFLSTDEAFWDRVIEINYKGILRTVHACLPSMVEARWGRIVNMSSVGARTGGISQSCIYAATKAGLIAITKNFARNLGPYGITTNAVAPGAIATPMAVEQSLSDESLLKRVVEATPVGRLGTADEAAATVVFLASEEASFITGACLDVNGGLTMS